MARKNLGKIRKNVVAKNIIYKKISKMLQRNSETVLFHDLLISHLLIIKFITYKIMHFKIKFYITKSILTSP